MPEEKKDSWPNGSPIFLIFLKLGNSMSWFTWEKKGAISQVTLGVEKCVCTLAHRHEKKSYRCSSTFFFKAYTSSIVHPWDIIFCDKTWNCVPVFLPTESTYSTKDQFSKIVLKIDGYLFWFKTLIQYIEPRYWLEDFHYIN